MISLLSRLLLFFNLLFSQNLLLAYAALPMKKADSHHPQDYMHNTSSILKHYCATCHSQEPLIAVGAPRPKIQKDWEERLKQDPQQLMQHVYVGLGAMPPRGGCFECSDQQLLLATIELLKEDASVSFLEKLKKLDKKA